MEEWLALPWWQQDMYLDELQADPQVRRDRAEEDGDGEPTGPPSGGPPGAGGSEDLGVSGMQALGIKARQVPAAG